MKKIDLFATIHKAIRGMFYDMSLKIQKANLADVEETHNLIAEIKFLFEMLERHSHHEDHCVFPLAVAVDKQAIEEIENEHLHYDTLINEFIALLDIIKNIEDNDERLTYHQILNLKFSEFLAFTLLHLNKEESIIMPLLQEHYTNEQLIAVRTKIQMSIPQEEYDYWMNWMLSNISVNELLDMFKEIKTSAPVEIFDFMLLKAKKNVEPQRFSVLENSI